jgi:hypothetical protein
LQIPVSKKPTAFLLPPYDEYIIAYADRSAVTNGEAKKSNLFENGLFKSVIVVNGKAVGNWKRQKPTVEVKYLSKPAKTTIALIKKAIKRYERFAGNV